MSIKKQKYFFTKDFCFDLIIIGIDDTNIHTQRDENDDNFDGDNDNWEDFQIYEGNANLLQ